MSIAADTFAVTPAEAAVEAESRPAGRRLAIGKFAVAFAATILVGSGLRAVAEAGVNQAIDNHYAKKAAAFTEPMPEMIAAIDAVKAEDAAAAAATAE